MVESHNSDSPPNGAEKVLSCTPPPTLRFASALTWGVGFVTGFVLRAICAQIATLLPLFTPADSLATFAEAAEAADYTAGFMLDCASAVRASTEQDIELVGLLRDLIR